MFCLLPPTEAAATLLADTGCSTVIEGANSPCTKAVSFTVVDNLPWGATHVFALFWSQCGDRRYYWIRVSINGPHSVSISESENKRYGSNGAGSNDTTRSNV